MRKAAFKAALPIVCAVFLISACSTTQSGPSEKSLQLKSVPRPAVNESNIHKNTVIPSYNGPKYTTTNRKGTQFNGMGTTIHSRIGSSGLTAEGEGQSAELEGMLNKHGIQGIKVLKLGDTVVLGQQQGVSSEMHPLQSKLLSPYTGMSGTSNKHSKGSTAVRSDKEDKKANLEQARLKVQALLGGHARVLTVTDKRALAAMERAKAKEDSSLNLRSSNKSSNKVTAQSQDIALILKHAKGSK